MTNDLNLTPPSRQNQSVGYAAPALAPMYRVVYSTGVVEHIKAEPGLVNSHISHRAKAPRPLANIKILPGGMKVKRQNLSPVRPPVCGRGAIYGFSAGSKRRMIFRLMCLAWDLLMPPPTPGQVYGGFVTLTYPDEFPGDWQRWKRDLDAFIKRLVRYYPGVALIWKLELKKRKTGEKNKGKLAPHFHLLIYFQNGLNMGDFRQWLSLNWYEVVASEDIKHLAAGTQAKPLYGTVAKLMNYCSKYLGKDFEVDFATGRCWGEYGSMPYGEIYSFENVDYIELCRRVRVRFKASPYLRSRKCPAGMVIFGEVAYLTLGLLVSGAPPPPDKQANDLVLGRAKRNFRAKADRRRRWQEKNKSVVLDWLSMTGPERLMYSAGYRGQEARE